MRQITLVHPQNGLEKQLLNLFHSSNLPLHFNHKGNKQFTNYQRISLVVIFRRENKPIRDFIEWLGESKWISWLGLKKVPQRSTLHDWLDLFDTKLIRELIDLSVDKLNLKVTAIDGSGVDTNFKSSYYKKRLNDFGNETKESYHKLDIIVDTFNKKQIIDYSFLLKNRHDSFVAKRLLKKIKFRKCKILADKGYPNYDFIDEMKAKQNNLISPPKNYGRKCRHNNFKRERKIRNFESNKQIYRRRVIVESVFSSLKRKQQLKLRSRLSHMKKREMGWNILYYNIRRNIEFNGKNFEENLSFFILIFEIYVTPDKAAFLEFKKIYNIRCLFPDMRYFIVSLIAIFVFVIIGVFVYLGFFLGDDGDGIFADIFQRKGNDNIPEDENANNPRPEFEEGGSSGGSGGGAGGAGSGSGSAGSSGGGIGGLFGCDKVPVSYALKNLYENETCNSFQDGYCIDKTVRCSIEVHNLDVNITADFNLILYFFDEQLSKGEAFDTTNIDTTVGPLEFKIAEGVSSVQSTGENGIANQGIACSFNTREQPGICA